MSQKMTMNELAGGSHSQKWNESVGIFIICNVHSDNLTMIRIHTKKLDQIPDICFFSQKSCWMTTMSQWNGDSLTIVPHVYYHMNPIQILSGATSSLAINRSETNDKYNNIHSYLVGVYQYDKEALAQNGRNYCFEKTSFASWLAWSRLIALCSGCINP